MPQNLLPRLVKSSHLISSSPHLKRIKIKAEAKALFHSNKKDMIEWTPLRKVIKARSNLPWIGKQLRKKVTIRFFSKSRGSLEFITVLFQRSKSLRISFRSTIVRLSMVRWTQLWGIQLRSPIIKVGRASWPRSTDIWKSDVTLRSDKSESGWRKCPTAFAKIMQIKD